MFRENLFRAKLAEKEISVTELAKRLNCSVVTLYRKINGESDFTRDEIQQIRTILELPDEEVISIFFAS